MATCDLHGEYLDDHGCGTAVLHGSAYAEHDMNCPLGVASSGPMAGGFFGDLGPGRYHPWEAPAGNCPMCWHRSRKDSAKE
jgi:hypothetical protein